MLRGIDKTATFVFTPPGQDGAERPLRLVCRYMTYRQTLEYAERRQAYWEVEGDRAKAAHLLDTLAIAVVRVENGPSDDLGCLLDVATPYQLYDWCAWIVAQQQVSEAELGKSEWQRRGSAGPSAETAGVADA